MRLHGKRIKFETVLVAGITYKLDLRSIDNGSNRSDRFAFQVVNQDPPINLTGSDLSALVREAEAELREKLKIEWVPCIEIYTQSGDTCHYGSDGETLLQESMALRASLVEVGTRPDGTKMHRTRQGNNRGHIFDGLPEDPIVPDTEVNRARLQMIADGLRTLGEKLTTLLSQDRAQLTLQDVRLLNPLVPALPPPEGRKARRRSST